jgi:hypothetical protein
MRHDLLKLSFYRSLIRGIALAPFVVYFSIKKILMIVSRVESRFDSLMNNELQIRNLENDLRLEREKPNPLGRFSWFAFTGRSKVPDLPSIVPLVPGSVKQQDVLTDDYLFWLSELKLEPLIDNKYWQYVTLLHNIHTNFGSIEGNGEKKALVVGVGQEPTVSFLADAGWRITATDFLDNEKAEAWATTSQLADGKESLFRKQLCKKSTFDSQVDFINLDMNVIPTDFDEKFDLVWSLCALGHIGGYQKGLDFVNRSRQLLKPGGIAVHTTEMDSSLVLGKFDTPDLSFYKRVDLESLLHTISESGFHVPEHDFGIGCGVLDKELDVSPYRQTSHHLRFWFDHREITPTSIVFTRP